MEKKIMPDNLIGEIRRSAVLMTYAPGAIMDMRADGGPVSAVSAGLEEWDRSAPLAGNLKFQKNNRETALQKKLGKKIFSPSSSARGWRDKARDGRP
ncbi:hypothetical protein ACFS07_10835 [Undibacterium arcticum]